ncbi:conjugal transfer protein TraO [Pseudomonas sp. DC3000-4b1]|uniref:conjugal transfer protein TraO n=1 Tax=unclassified Pseudomonas TaxID=196821 RepID=UPI003CF91A9D
MANENDAKRDLKMTALLVGGVLVVLIGGGYILWNWMATPPPAPSKVNLYRVSGAAQNEASESQEYRDLLRLSNEQGAHAAKQENGSFIASIPMEQNTVMQPEPAFQPVQQTPPTPRPSHTRQATASEGNQKKDPRQDALKALMGRINSQTAEAKTSTGLTLGKVMGDAGGLDRAGGSAAGSVGGYDHWSETLPGGAKQQSASGGGDSYSAVEIVPPYWRGAGEISMGVDSDNNTTPVLGKLSGAYAGAVLKAPEGARLAGEGVVIHFTEMAFKGINYKIDAYALHEQTLMANVATDVNHRYMERIVLPAILAGIGNIGEMYSQANTEVLTNGFSTQTVRPGMPDGAAVAGSIAGGAAEQAAQVLTQDAARTPATQVTVTAGQVVSIQFMRGVYAGDAVAPKRTGDSVQSAAPAQALRSDTEQPQAPVQPVTPNQWRAQAQSRIEAQRKLQESQP